MLNKQELSQIQDYIVQILPQVLRQNPEMTRTIEGIIAEQFPRREEFDRLLDEVIRLLDELKSLSEESNRHKEQLELRLELQSEEMSQLREEMKLRFKQQEADMLDIKSDIHEIKEGFSQQQSDRLDLKSDMQELKQGFSQQQSDIQELKQGFRQQQSDIQELKQGFSQQQSDMQGLKQGFSQQQSDMQGLKQGFSQQQSDMLEIKSNMLNIKRRMLKVESTVEGVSQKITQFDAWLKIVTGNIGTEKGQKLEELFALGLAYGLKNPNIKPETIQLRQLFMDGEGLVFFRKGQYIEVDIIAENGKYSVFEVKATARIEDVDMFARKVKLIALQNPDKQVEGIFLSPGIEESVKQCCAEYGLECIF